MLAGSASLTFKWGKTTCAEHLWREVLQPCGGSVVATWQEGRLAGAPAVIEHRTGAGRCFYIGTYASTKLAADWLPALAAAAAVEPIIRDLPAGVEVVRRTGRGRALTFILNHTAEEKKVAHVPSGTDLITGARAGSGPLLLGAFGVAVVRTA